MTAAERDTAQNPATVHEALRLLGAELWSLCVLVMKLSCVVLLIAAKQTGAVVLIVGRLALLLLILG